MNINIAWPSGNSWKAAGRNVASFAAGLVGGGGALLSFGVALHYITPQQSSELLGALTNISNGIKLVTEGLGNIVTGLSVLVLFATSSWAAYMSTRKQQAASLAAKGDVVVTDPAIAAAVPSPNVVAKDATAAVAVPGAVVKVTPQ